MSPRRSAALAVAAHAAPVFAALGDPTRLALVTRFYPEAAIPFVSTQEFWVLLFAQFVLVFGCIMRGL